MRRPAMRGIIVLLLTGVMGLSACSGWRTSSVNPSNWFGRSRPANVNPEELAGAPVNPLLPKSADTFIAGAVAAVDGVTIDQISTLVIEPTVEGAIIRAEGIAVREGAYAARLIPETLDETPIDGVLSYRFVVKYPNEATAAGTQATRTISVARSVTSGHLEATRTIRVIGQQNARESRRR